MTRRRLLAALAVVIAVAAVLLLWPRKKSRRGDAAGEADAGARAGSQPPPGYVDPLAGLPSEAERSQPRKPGATEAGTNPMMAFADNYYTNPEGVRELMEEYRRANVYPPESKRLRPDMMDVIEPNRTYEPPLPLLDPAKLDPDHPLDPETTVFFQFDADRFAYIGNDEIRLRLDAYRGQTAKVPLAIEVGPVSVAALSVDGDRDAGHITLAGDDPKGAKAGPDLPPYTATFRPARVLAGHTGLIRFTAPIRNGAEQATATLVLSYTDAAPAKFTRVLRETVDAGSLVITVGVDVKTAGRYQISGRLFAADGVAPVAVTTFSGPLEKGVVEVPLRYYGKIFHDAGVPGPYVQRDLFGYRQTDGATTTRGEEMLPLTAPFTTAPHTLNEFTNAEWSSPQKTAALENFQREIERLEAAKPK